MSGARVCHKCRAKLPPGEAKGVKPLNMPDAGKLLNLADDRSMSSFSAERLESHNESSYILLSDRQPNRRLRADGNGPGIASTCSAQHHHRATTREEEQSGVRKQQQQRLKQRRSSLHAPANIDSSYLTALANIASSGALPKSGICVACLKLLEEGLKKAAARLEFEVAKYREDAERTTRESKSDERNLHSNVHAKKSQMVEEIRQLEELIQKYDEEYKELQKVDKSLNQRHGDEDATSKRELEHCAKLVDVELNARRFKEMSREIQSGIKFVEQEISSLRSYSILESAFVVKCAANSPSTINGLRFAAPGIFSSTGRSSSSLAASFIKSSERFYFSQSANWPEINAAWSSVSTSYVWHFSAGLPRYHSF